MKIKKKNIKNEIKRNWKEIQRERERWNMSLMVFNYAILYFAILNGVMMITNNIAERKVPESYLLFVDAHFGKETQ